MDSLVTGQKVATSLRDNARLKVTAAAGSSGFWRLLNGNSQISQGVAVAGPGSFILGPFDFQATVEVTCDVGQFMIDELGAPANRGLVRIVADISIGPDNWEQFNGATLLCDAPTINITFTTGIPVPFVTFVIPVSRVLLQTDGVVFINGDHFKDKVILGADLNPPQEEDSPVPDGLLLNKEPNLFRVLMSVKPDSFVTAPDSWLRTWNGYSPILSSLPQILQALDYSDSFNQPSY